MKTVRDMLNAKQGETHTIAPDETVFRALEKMAENEVGALLVLKDEKVVGIISERDYARKVILKGASSLDTPVSKIMTRDVIYVGPDQTVEECMALMTDKRIRHLPVVVDRRLAGMISIGDVVKAVIADREFAIRQLESYISGG